MPKTQFSEDWERALDDEEEEGELEESSGEDDNEEDEEDDGWRQEQGAKEEDSIKEEMKTPVKSCSKNSAMFDSPLPRGHSCKKSLVCFCICVSSV